MRPHVLPFDEHRVPQLTVRIARHGLQGALELCLLCTDHLRALRGDSLADAFLQDAPPTAVAHATERIRLRGAELRQGLHRSLGAPGAFLLLQLRLRERVAPSEETAAPQRTLRGLGHATERLLELLLLHREHLRALILDLRLPALLDRAVPRGVRQPVERLTLGGEHLRHGLHGRLGRLGLLRHFRLVRLHRLHPADVRASAEDPLGGLRHAA
mmetsp:Transcript_70961/g.217491  ORF Transcript_70961/g.217491 Transcript_70961/m.217491 type:complete len:214 (+) Transcript_70961:2228-2869(+)